MKLLLNTEFLRRLALALGLFISIIMFTHAAPYLYEVESVNFAKQYKQIYISMVNPLRAKKMVYTHRAKQNPGKDYSAALKSIDQKLKAIDARFKKQSLEDYIAQQTSGMIIKISGPQWDALLSKMKQHLKGQTPAELQPNRSVKAKSTNLYFLPGTGPFANALGRYGQKFVVYEHDGATRYLKLSTFSPVNRMNQYAQDDLVYPWRGFWWIPLMLGLLLYLVVIPKVKAPEDALAIPRLWGVMVTDFFGLLFGGGLLLFGALFMQSKQGTLFTLFTMESGFAIGVLVIWALGLLVMLGVMRFGIVYRNYWLKLLPDGLEEHTHKGTRFYAYSSMKRAALLQKDRSWMIRLAMLLSFFGPSPGSTAMVVASDNNTIEQYLSIEMIEGPSCLIKLRRFTIAGYDTAVAVARTLSNNGIALDDALAKALENQSPDGA